MGFRHCAVHQQGELLRRLFGERWSITAARVFGCQRVHVYHIAEGIRPLTYQHLRAMTLYASQRWEVKSRLEREVSDRAVSALRSELAEMRSAASQVSAILAEMRRQRGGKLRNSKKATKLP